MGAPENAAEQPSAAEMTGGPAELSERELDLLATFEEDISHAESKHYWALGKALRAIRDDRLYRREGSFEDYCLRRWGWRRQTGNRYVSAVVVAEDLERHGMRPPMTEKQARPLGRLDWRGRVEVASWVEAEGGWRRVAAPRVAQIADEVAPRSAAKAADGPALALVLVSGRAGVGPTTLARSGLLRDLEAMSAAALRTAQRGPHAIPDAAAALSPDEAERCRALVERVGWVVLRWSQSIEAYHGAQPAGQQRMPLAA